MTHTAVAPTPSYQRSSRIALGMAHLAPRGLSEDWWLKHLGDVHWQLIADAVGQNTIVFRDRQGRQLYAAFCATEFEQHKPDAVHLGASLDLHSELWAAGRSRIQSTHRLSVRGIEVARFRLVSTFVAHMTAGLNASVKRATPYLIPVLQAAPDDFARRNSVLAKKKRQTRIAGAPQVTLAPNIGTDFNAVGLLYFPSFTRLFEHVETTLAHGSGSPWSPVAHRTVLYFGNVEMGEAICGTRTRAQDFDLWQSGPEGTEKRPLASCTVRRH